MVSEEMTAIEVLRHMSQAKVSAVPVLDEVGVWIATFSLTDLKVFIRYLSMEHMDLPILTLIALLRQKEDVNARSQTMSISPSSTLSQTISKLAATSVHRLFVRFDSEVPSGVVSLTNILNFLLVDSKA